MKKRKLKKQRIILLIIFIICLGTFIFSSIKIISRLKDKKETDKLLDNINSLVDINDYVDEDILSEIPEALAEETPNYYYDYLKVPFMEVDFSKLKDINKDVVGWVNVVGAGVNYPYVQTNNNEYYLTHGFDKKINASGWVFLDYRNDQNNQNKNTIIYAHGGNRITLFGPLKDIYNKKDWYNNKDNHYIKISTNEYNLVYKVFSLYVTPTTIDYLDIDFSSDAYYEDFLNMLKERSYYEFETDISTLDNIITLSTCYNKKEKLVLHGKLIKQEKK